MRLRLTPTEIRRRAVRAAAAAAGLSVFACSDAATSTNGTVDVVAIDTIGELPALMSLDLQLGDN